MREIKFRAWDKTGKYKSMCQVINLYSGEHPFAQCACDWQDGDVYRWRVFTRGLDAIELMQFTGLKDKNGKEIWEGDILRSVYGENGNVAGFVFYRAFEFVCMRKSKKSWHDFGCVVGEEGEIYEVIGNIYSNPELLK